MNSMVMMVAVAAVGVDFGWEPDATETHLEYVIQIEPVMLEHLKPGDNVIRCEIPPDQRGGHRFRIRIGEDTVPQQDLPPGVGVPGGEPPLEPPTEPPPRFDGDDIRQRFGGEDATDAKRGAEGAPSLIESERFSGDLGPPAAPGGDDSRFGGEPAKSGLDGGITPIADPNSEPPSPRPLKDDTTGVREPESFHPDDKSEALAHKAAFEQHVDEESGQEGDDPAQTSNDDQAPSPGDEPVLNEDEGNQRPWVFTVLGLFTSLGLNGYLGFIAFDRHRRYRTAIMDNREA